MPERLALQISRRCNLECRMCGWSVWKRNAGFMSREVFERALDEAARNGIYYLAFSSAQGEPLLSPLCGEFLHEALTRGFHVEINTNCTPLNDRNIDMLVKAARTGRLVIQASFSGYDKETHEQIYAGSDFARTALKLATLNAQLASEQLSDCFWVNGIIMDMAEKQKHLDYLRALGIEQRVKIHQPDNFAGIVALNAPGNSFRADLDHRGLRLCPVLVRQMVVYDDGSVSACACRDSENVMPLGKIEDGIHALRNGAKYHKMLDAFMRRDLKDMPLCKNCDIPYGDTGF